MKFTATSRRTSPSRRKTVPSIPLRRPDRTRTRCPGHDVPLAGVARRIGHSSGESFAGSRETCRRTQGGFKLLGGSVLGGPRPMTLRFCVRMAFARIAMNNRFGRPEREEPYGGCNGSQHDEREEARHELAESVGAGGRRMRLGSGSPRRMRRRPR